MIKVLEEKQVPKATIRCNNCESLIEYENGDLQMENVNGFIVRHFFQCPVCRCTIYAKWIRPKEKGE